MDSSIGQIHQHNFGLLRYRSAPSSLLASLSGNINSNGCVYEDYHLPTEDHVNQDYHLPSTSSEMETMLTKLVSSNHRWSNSEPLQEFMDKPVKQEIGDSVQQQNGYPYGGGSQLIYNSQQIQGFVNGFSMASENSTQSNMGVSNCSNLIRQKSSPAGFFSNENGLAATSGLNGTENFPSRLSSSCLTRMPQIAENRNESLESNCDQSNMVNYNGISKFYMPSFTSDIWDNSAFSAQKTEREDEIMFSTANDLESQDADFCYQNLGLTQHLSLPSPSTRMASMKKFLQIQGAVPCKIRAKRGFATHPRSIAERVRRTRISERIKKLEGLFPKADKQTSTADMLDLAVEYIKELQDQVKILKDCREKCKCTRNEKQYSRCCT